MDNLKFCIRDKVKWYLDSRSIVSKLVELQSNKSVKDVGPYTRMIISDSRSEPVEQHYIEQLTKHPASRYSFVVNTMLNICKYPMNNDK